MASISRRAPLANISNATNSPHRLLTNSGSKRSRAAANVNQQENEPPPKRLAVEREGDAAPVTPKRRPQPTVAETKVFERGTSDNTAATALQQRLVAVRQGHSRASKAAEIDSIKQWQKHYKKLFPTFSFYFDSVPDELQARFSRHVRTFGSRVEAFFSKNVTHIITTRPIPAELNTPTSPDSIEPGEGVGLDEQTQTINPSLLERHSHTRAVPPVADASRAHAPMDILMRGRQMGMKIWAAEKLQRMLTSMVEDPAIQAGYGRSHQGTNGKPQENLSQVLKNEKIGTATEREQISMPREMVLFRGPFLYVHDMDEKMRPTMIREYPKVARRQDGEWPQFRSATAGKCPFLEDPGVRKEEQERARQKALMLQQAKEQAQLARTRTAATPADSAKMEPPQRTSPRKTALRENRNPPAGITKQREGSIPPPPPKVDRQSSFPSMPEQPPVSFVRPSHIQLTREPAASGIQRSNVTSAIQSQIISSTAATGIKASTSRDVHELKRKVLEKTHTGSLSMGSIPSSHRTAELVGALKTARAIQPQRMAKTKAQEKLGGIEEELDPSADELAIAAAAAKKKKANSKRDPKPGYCENCRDKYDDFEEHIVSRKHRKFAMTPSNWSELDALLSKLQAP